MHPRSKVWVLAGGLAAVGVVLGWAFGTWTACGEGCRYDAETFGAVGTWLGGAGTMGALYFAAVQIREAARGRDLEHQRWMTERASEEAAAQKERDRQLQAAQRVIVSSWVGAWSSDIPSSVACRVFNHSHDADIFDVSVLIAGRVPVTISHVKPQAAKASNYIQVESWEPYMSEKDETVEPQLMTQDTVLEFTMFDERWRRRGNEPTERAER